MRDLKIYLEDILESIKNIQEDTKGLTIKEFIHHRMLQQATVRNLEIIGEAVQQLPGEFKQNYPDIPWHKIVAVRNKIIHEYFGLKLDVLWQTIVEDLPQLKKQIKNILQENS